MMDQTAVNAIRDMVSAQKTQEILGHTQSGSLQVIIPKDYMVFDLERFNDSPNRFRGKFSTHLISEFVEYVNTNGTDSTQIFVDIENSRAQAIIDLAFASEPGWGDHRAAIQLKKTPEYSALIANMTKPHSQDEFIDFIEDFAPNISFLSGDETPQIDTSSAIQAIRKITVSTASDKTSETGDFKASQSSFDQIEIKAKVGTMPAGFNFTCVPYDGMREVVFACRLRALTSSDSPRLVYRIIGLDRAVNDIGLAFKEILDSGISTTGAFYCGNMDYQGK